MKSNAHRLETPHARSPQSEDLHLPGKGKCRQSGCASAIQIVTLRPLSTEKDSIQKDKQECILRPLGCKKQLKMG